MIVTCERCNAKYKLDEAKIKGRGAKITCPRCHHIFVVYQTQSPSAPSGTSGPSVRPLSVPSGTPKTPGPAAKALSVPTPAPQPTSAQTRSTNRKTADELDFRKVGIPTWKVKVKIGLVYDFSDIRTLRKYIQDKRVTEDDVISSDGSNWVRIGDIPDMNLYFIQVYEDLEAKLREARGAGKEEFEDGPTMIVGMGSLGSNLSTGVFAKVDSADAPPSAPNLSLAPSSGVSSASGAHTFSDPFDALKKTHQKRLQDRKAEPGKAAVAAAAASSNRKRNLRWAAVGLLLILVLGGGLAWGLTHRPVEPTPTPTDNTPTTPPADDASLFREKMKTDLANSLQGTDKDPIAITDDEPKAALTPVKPNGLVPAGNAPVTMPGMTAPAGVRTGQTTAAEWLSAGDSAAGAERWTEAADAYCNATVAEPKNARYQYLCGNAAFKAGQLDRAEEALNRALSLGSKSASCVLGDVLNEKGDISGATGRYSECLKTSPPNAGAIEEKIKKLTGG